MNEIVQWDVVLDISPMQCLNAIDNNIPHVHSHFIFTLHMYSVIYTTRIFTMHGSFGSASRLTQELALRACILHIYMGMVWKRLLTQQLALVCILHTRGWEASDWPQSLTAIVLDRTTFTLLLPCRPAVCVKGNRVIVPTVDGPDARVCRGHFDNVCNFGYVPKYGSYNDDCPCTCVKAPKADPSKQHNCKADCLKTVYAANEVCFNTPHDSCAATNPYGSGKASCGYGTIQSKKKSTCPQCRCQVLGAVCGIGPFDDHCTPSQT